MILPHFWSSPGRKGRNRTRVWSGFRMMFVRVSRTGVLVMK
ncbi:MAG: hypothetical protein ACK5EN_09670 [Planctomyces sp.]